MNTVIVLFQGFSQPVSQEWTQWLFYSRYLHSQCARSEHSDCSIPGIFSQCPRSVHSHCFIPGIFTVSVPGMNTVIVLFQVSSQPVSQEWTQWLFHSRCLHSQCPRSVHSYCSIPGIFTASVAGVNTVIVLFQVSSQSVCQKCTQWVFYSRYLHSQCARSEHSDCSIPGIFTVSIPGMYTVTGIFTFSIPGVYTVIVLFQVFSQPVSQEWTQWLFYSRYFHNQCPRSVHSYCSIPRIFTASVAGVNTVIALFQVFSQPVSQEWTQWLFYSRYLHSQCRRSEHSDCSIPGIFTATVPGVNTVIVLFQVSSVSVPGVYIVTVLFQVFSQSVSQEWTQWLFYSRYFHSQCPRNEHSDCSIPGIFTASVPGVNTVIVLFQVSSVSVPGMNTVIVLYPRYFHSQCPRNEHSDCSIPGIFTASVPGVNTVTVPF